MSRQYSLAGLLLVTLLGLSACGGGSSGSTGAQLPPDPPSDDPPAEDGIVVAGKLPAVFTEPTAVEAKIVYADVELTGTVDADGNYEIRVPEPALSSEALARVEVIAGTLKMVAGLTDLNRFAALAGDDSRLSNDEFAAVDISEMATANYAVLFAENGDQHPQSEAALDILRRDRLDGELSLQLAAALRLHARDGGALPTGVADTWDLLVNHEAAYAFIESVRNASLVSKSASLQSKTDADDPVDATIEELLQEPAQSIPFVSVDGLPALAFYRMTTISRNLDGKLGLLINFAADGTGTYRNAGGHDGFSWQIDSAGRLELTLDNGAPVYTAGEDADGPYEIKHTTEKAVITRLSEGALADMLHVAFYNWSEFTDAAHVHLNQTRPAELETTGRAMIAVRSGGAIAWTSDEPLGIWALPGVLSGPDQTHAADIPVKTDDMYEFRIDVDGTPRGTALLSNETFTWQFQGEFADEMRGVLVNFDENGSGVTFYRLREDRDAYDIANAAAAADPVTGDLKKAINGSLGFKRDPSFVFDPVNAAGAYRLFGESSTPFDMDETFDMFLEANNSATLVLHDADSVLIFENERYWEVDAEGNLVVSARWDADAITGEPTTSNPACVDSAACAITHERVLYPFRRNGDRIYVLEDQRWYDVDNTADFSKGNVSRRQIQVRYWDVQPLP